MLTEYSKAPQVTRDRMYLETMQQVFTNTSKVYIDSRNSSLLSLPLDRLLQTQTAGEPGRAATTPPAAAPAAPVAPLEPASDVNRAREGLRSRDRDTSR